MGTQVVVDPPPEKLATEPAASGLAPPAPIPQIYQPAAKAAAEEGQVRIWTAEDEARLRQLYHAGKTDKQIGKELGRSAKAVSIRIAKLKLKQDRQGQSNDGGDG